MMAYEFWMRNEIMELLPGMVDEILLVIYNLALLVIDLMRIAQMNVLTVHLIPSRYLKINEVVFMYVVMELDLQEKNETIRTQTLVTDAPLPVK